MSLGSIRQAAEARQDNLPEVRTESDRQQDFQNQVEDLVTVLTSIPEYSRHIKSATVFDDRGWLVCHKNGFDSFAEQLKGIVDDSINSEETLASVDRNDRDSGLPGINIRFQK